MPRQALNHQYCLPSIVGRAAPSLVADDETWRIVQPGRHETSEGRWSFHLLTLRPASIPRWPGMGIQSSRRIFSRAARDCGEPAPGKGGVSIFQAGSRERRSRLRRPGPIPNRWAAVARRDLGCGRESRLIHDAVQEVEAAIHEAAPAEGLVRPRQIEGKNFIQPFNLPLGCIYRQPSSLYFPICW